MLSTIPSHSPSFLSSHPGWAPRCPSVSSLAHAHSNTHTHTLHNHKCAHSPIQKDYSPSARWRSAQPQDRAQGPWSFLSEVPGHAPSGLAHYRLPEVTVTGYSAADPAHSYSLEPKDSCHTGYMAVTGHIAAGPVHPYSQELSVPTGFRGRVCNQVPHHPGPAPPGDSLSQSPSVDMRFLC